MEDLQLRVGAAAETRCGGLTSLSSVVLYSSRNTGKKRPSVERIDQSADNNCVCLISWFRFYPDD